MATMEHVCFTTESEVSPTAMEIASFALFHTCGDRMASRSIVALPRHGRYVEVDWLSEAVAIDLGNDEAVALHEADIEGELLMSPQQRERTS